MKPNFIFIAALSGLLTVMIGAFGAHAIKASLSAYSYQVFQTAVFYQAIHSLAILFVGLLYLYQPIKSFRLSAWFFLAGIFIFSGSLYGLAITDIKKLGMITPIGGVSFMLGWLFLAIGSWHLKSSD